MATKLTKTDVIRSILKDDPDAPPSKIVALAKKQGVKMTPAYASTIKSKLRAGSLKRSRNGHSRSNGRIHLQAEDVAGFFVDVTRRFGGDLTKARAAIDLLERAGA